MLNAWLPASLRSHAPALWLYFVQFIFLATGVFSTCAAQYVFYQGAGDQKAMLLPLCNFLGIMLVGVIPVTNNNNATNRRSKAASDATPTTEPKRLIDIDSNECDDEPERTGGGIAATIATIDNDHPWDSDATTNHRHHQQQTPLLSETELTRRQGGVDSTAGDDTDGYSSTTDTESTSAASSPASTSTSSSALDIKITRSTVSCSFSALQLCIGLSVVLDFGGCIFSNIGLAMAGSGLYQVVYSSVICWSALLSRFVLKKDVSKEEWFGIGLVTFGLAFSALGESGAGRNNYVVLMGCLNTLLGAAFYGGNYVTGEYMLKLPERPQPQELCLKIGAACVGIIAVYQLFFVLPAWHELVTKSIEEHHGNTTGILAALFGYTLSQLAHGLTYFLLLGSSGAVTTGIMQSLRAVCVFFISSVLYCSHQESQCFDTKRGLATLIVVSGVMFYSWAKSQAKRKTPTAFIVGRKKKTKLIAGKNFVV